MKEGDIMRIALVDDNRDDLQTLHRCLTENLISDYDIVEFTGGDEFLKSFTDNSYDLIVLDIYMGEFNGIEVAREIRKRIPMFSSHSGLQATSLPPKAMR